MFVSFSLSKTLKLSKYNYEETQSILDHKHMVPGARSFWGYPILCSLQYASIGVHYLLPFKARQVCVGRTRSWFPKEAFFIFQHEGLPSVQESGYLGSIYGAHYIGVVPLF